MKKLFIVLCLMASPAYAEEEWWESLNKSGGKIVLTNEPCTVRPDAKTLKRMFTNHRNGETYWGCWNYWSDQVHVIYDSGDSYTYDPALFSRKTAP